MGKGMDFNLSLCRFSGEAVESGFVNLISLIWDIDEVGDLGENRLEITNYRLEGINASGKGDGWQ